jgi:hypothetical protein
MTNIKHLPFEYIDSSALALYYVRSGLTRLTLNKHNFGSVQTQLEVQLQQLCRAQARMSQGQTPQGEAGSLPEILQFLALYVFGMLKTPLLSPVQQIPPCSSYLDLLANQTF